MALIHHWKLDETSGALVDIVGGLNGTASGTTSVPGLFGNARSFAANEYISLPANSDLNFGANPHSVFAWVRLDSVPGAIGAIMALYDNNGGQRSWAISCYPQKVSVWMSPDGINVPTILDVPFNLNLGELHHVGYTKGGTTLIIYIDGVVAMSGIAPATLYSNTVDNAYIGNLNPEHQYYFPGMIDNVQVWDHALTPTEVLEHFYLPLGSMSLVDQDPAPSETGVAVLKSPVVAIEDSANNIDLTTVSIWVDSVLAYDGATDTWQTGFTGSWTGDASKYTFTINPDVPFAISTTIPIRVYAENDASQILDITYSFTTDDTTMSLTDQDPAPEETGVLIAKTVNVAVQDGDESMAAASIKVWVHGELAYDGEDGGFQTGFSGTFGGTPAKYSLTIDHVVRFQYSHTIPVIVAAENVIGPMLKNYRFFTETDTYPPEIYAQDPVPDAVLMRVDKTIKFRLWDGMPLNLVDLIVDVDFGDGIYELAYDERRGGATLGFTTTITSISESWGGFAYEITVAHDRLFTSGGTVRVRVHAVDTAGIQNPLDVVYSFGVAVQPAVVPTSPAADATGVSIWSNVAFTVTGGSGTVTLSTVAVRIEGVLAYADEGFKAGFNGTVTANGSGYDFVVNPDADLPASSGIIVEVTGQNSLGHDIV